MKYLSILIFTIAAFTGQLWAQAELKLLRQGNSFYRDGKFKEAEINYRKALENNSRNQKARYNLGNAMYNQQSYEEAVNIYNELSEQKLDDETLAKVYHNLGNALLKNEKYAESIDAYKKSLRLNSKDIDTKYNLSYALSKLQQQQQQQQQEQDKQQQNQQEQEQKQQEQQQEKDQQQQDKQQQSKSGEMSKEDAERILNALQQQEKNVKDKADKNIQPVRIITEKDW